MVFLAFACLVNERAPAYPAESFIDRCLYSYWILVESALMLTFFAVISIGVRVLTFRSTWLRSFGSVVATATVCLPVLIGYADQMTRVTIGNRFLSGSTIEKGIEFAPYAHQYVTMATFSKFGGAVVVFTLVEGVFWFVATRVGSGEVQTRNKNQGVTWRRGLLIGVMLAGVGIALLLAAWKSPTHMAKVYRVMPMRHPIAMLGIVDWFLPPRSIWPEPERLHHELGLLRFGEPLARYRDGYPTLRFSVSESAPRPDILIVMSESFRHDAIALPQAPNLVALSEESIVGERHFSGGNATQFGVFSALSGLDVVLMDHGRHWPMALPKMLHDAGYFTAFMGSGSWGWMSVTDYLRPEDWDVYRDEDQKDRFYDRDRDFLSHAQDLFDRKREASSHEGPVCVFAFLVTTHWDYHFPEEDAIFKPYVKGNLPWAPHPRYDKVALKNRYLNSVHAMDRMVGPLLDRNRILVVMGDHGEAIFDYGTQLVHTNALSPAQLQTPFLFHVPQALRGNAGFQSCQRRVTEATHHMDLLPCLMDCLGVTASEPGLLMGQSVLRDVDSGRGFSVRTAMNRNVGIYAPYAWRDRDTLQMVQLSELDLWKPHVGDATVHDESGAFVQTLGGVREAFVADWQRWLTTAFQIESPADESVLPNNDPSAPKDPSVPKSDWFCRGLLSSLDTHRKYALWRLEMISARSWPADERARVAMALAELAHDDQLSGAKQDRSRAKALLAKWSE